MKMSPKTANVLLFLAHWALMTAVIQFAFKVIGDVWYQFPVLFGGLYIVIYGLMRFRSKYHHLFK
jgi:hypothetical protein